MPPNSTGAAPTLHEVAIGSGMRTLVQSLYPLSVPGEIELEAAAEKSRGYRLRREESAADGGRRLAANQAAKGVEGPREGGGGDAAATHGARTDLKKIRALLRLVRGGLDTSTHRAEIRRYGDAGRLLSESRE